MGRILCATRGGEESRRTHQAAVALAAERGDELIFLYVADASFLDQTAAALVIDIDRDLERMGRFQLAMACEGAAEQGVAARGVVRRGRLWPELAAAAAELDATLIVLGAPGEESAAFGHESLRALAAILHAQTGVEVRIVPRSGAES